MLFVITFYFTASSFLSYYNYVSLIARQKYEIAYLKFYLYTHYGSTYNASAQKLASRFNVICEGRKWVKGNSSFYLPFYAYDLGEVCLVGVRE